MGVIDAIARRVVVPLWAYRDDPGSGRRNRTLAKRQFDPPAVVAARQTTALRRLLRHAAATVPHYAGIDPEAVRTLADLRTLPTLTKADIRQHGEALRSRAVPAAGLTLKETSGSTGVPLRVWLDEAGLRWKRAFTLRSDSWSGWRPGERAAKLWGHPEKTLGLKARLRKALYERSTYLDTLRISDAALEAFARTVAREQPPLIFGHAHSLYLLADAVHRHGWPAARPRGIISTAMKLHAFERERIEGVFGCRVTDRYGCEEVSLIASECEQRHGLHVNADGLIVELIRPDGEPARPGEAGKVVLTDLVNRAMPLIRYEVGDVGVASDRVCPCGRGLPLIEAVQGREADYVVTAAGDRVSGISLTDHFATLVPGVRQFQIVQERVDRFVFRIAPEPGLFGPASERALAGLVAEHFGPASFSVELVDRIASEASGKYQFCISHVGGRAA